jgi:hypothetical protein
MKNLKKFTVAILFFIPFFVSAQEDDVIQWSAAKLTWNDYLAKPGEYDDAAAITSTALGIEYHVKDNVLTYKITCLFSKTKSWGRYKSDYILSHEQGHFDITEIFARKLAKAMDEFDFNPKTFRTDLDNIYQRIMKEKEDYQELYDQGTDYSRDKKMQTEWLKKIAAELEELEEWAIY